MAKLHGGLDVYLMHVYIARTNHLSCVTELFQCLLRQIVDLAIQEWLLSCPDVCLGTLTLVQPIVTKNMCLYGCNANLHHVLLLAVATQLRMNCFDDLLSQQIWFNVHCRCPLYSACSIFNAIAV